MVETLKKCPFCGGSPEVTTSDEHGCAVQCYCEVGPGIRGRADVFSAISLWNTRATDELVGALEGLADRVCLRVCELPDRTSPEDWPEACLVTSEELHAIIQDELSAHKGASQ